MGHRFTKTATKAPCCTTKNITKERRITTIEQPLPFMRINPSVQVIGPTSCNSKVDKEQQQCAGTCISVEDTNCQSETLNNSSEENLHSTIAKTSCTASHGEVKSPCSENKTITVVELKEEQKKCINLSEDNMIAPTQRIVITIHLTKMEITPPEKQQLSEKITLSEKHLTEHGGDLLPTTSKRHHNDIHFQANISASNNITSNSNVFSISKSPTESLLTLISSLMSESNITDKQFSSNSSRGYRILLESTKTTSLLDSLLEITEIAEDNFYSRMHIIDIDISKNNSTKLIKRNNRLLRFGNTVQPIIIKHNYMKQTSTCSYHKLRSMFNDNQVLTSNFHEIMTILATNERFCNRRCCKAFKQILDMAASRLLASTLTIYKIRLSIQFTKYLQTTVVELPSTMRLGNKTFNKILIGQKEHLVKSNATSIKSNRIMDSMADDYTINNTGQLTINRVISDNLSSHSCSHIMPHLTVATNNDTMVTNSAALSSDQLKWTINSFKELQLNEVSTPQLFVVQCAFINSSADISNSTELQQSNKISTVYIHPDSIDRNHFVNDRLVSVKANNVLTNTNNDSARNNETTETKAMPSAIQVDASNLNKSVNRAELCPVVHSQVDFCHYLVPDLQRIVNSSFYWGKMDRYEAERLLDGKPEGSFLLRDSAQEEFLFSVTFRKFGRSLHARIEQSEHRFSFDCHDPCVFTAPTIIGLLEHYKDPACVMFFEPMLTIPLHRKSCFSLQNLCRATIVSHTTYDGINKLELPVRIKSYLKEYHYKQKLRVKPFDDSFYNPCTS